ncbi:MAG: gluconate 2-dehydrogenase subunit 3 family protein [Bacteroidia bacterium]|nr:gluconate 2-dehydrogenase subunit 3 family protein [Bacteroidia bacterium]
MGVLNGCTAKPTINWTPAFFTKDQGILVTQVADIIIPKTDTPGAADVGVPDFIDNLLKDCYDKEGQDKFIAALNAFDEGQNRHMVTRSSTCRRKTRQRT